MPGAQIDLVLRAVQPEADGAICVTAIKVIDQLDLYLLSHNRLFLSWAWRISLANPSRWAQPLQAEPALPCRAGTVRMAALVVSLEPDELQGLRAITEVEAAASGREADLRWSAITLMHAALEARLEELGLRWNPSPEAVRQRAALEMRPVGWVMAVMKNDRARKLVVSGLAVAALIVLWGGYIQGWTWTGFQGNEQLWEWLHLLLLPVVVGTLPLWIQHPEYMSRTRRLMYVTAAAAFTALVLAGYLVPLNWTGFPGNTLWDWLGLMLLPVAVATARFLSAVVRSLRPCQEWGIATVAVAWALTIAGGYSWHWTWTGYQEIPSGTGSGCCFCPCSFRQ